MKRGLWVWIVLVGAMAGLARAEGPPAGPVRPAAARAAEDRKAPDLLLGRWEGAWTSDAHKRSGPLACTVTLGEDGTYVARFVAKYLKIFTNKSTVVMTVEKGEGEWRFTGECDLGFLAGGVYSHEGTSDGEELVSRFKAKKDRGEFRLKRIAADPAD